LALVSGLLYINTMPHTAMTSDPMAYLSSAKAWVTGGLTGMQEGLRNTNTARMPWYVALETVIVRLTMGQPREAVEQVIRTVQIFLYAINIGLIGLLTSWISRSTKLGFVAGGLALFYTPFLFQADKLLSETLGITFLLLFLCSLWRPQRWPCVMPLLLFLTLSNRFQTYWPMTLLGLVLISIFQGKRFWQNRTNWWTVCIVLGVGLLLQSFFWVFKVASLKPVFLAQYVDTNGWAPMVEIYGMISFLMSQTETLPNWLPQGLSTPVQMALKWILYHPDILLQRWLVNLTRFFALPDNGYQLAWLGMGPGLLNVFHMILLWGVWPTISLAVRNRKLWIPLAMLGIWASMHALSHIELRYSLIVMPMVMMLSVLGWRSAWQDRNWQLVLAMLVGFGLFYLPPGLPQGLAILGLGVLMTLSLQLPQKLAGMITLIALIPVTAAQLLEPQLSSRSEHDSPARQQTIQLPASFWDQPPHARVSTFLLVDGQELQELEVKINGIPVQAAPLPAGLFQQMHLLGGLRKPEEIRQYRWFKLPESVLDSMQKTQTANIRFHGYADLFVDYPQGAQYCLPDPDWNRFSIYKDLYDGEGRATVCFPAAKGMQGPRYRMMLYRLLTDEANQPDFPRANLNQMPDGTIQRYVRVAY